MQINATGNHQPVNALQNTAIDKAQPSSNNQTSVIPTDTVTISNAGLSIEEKIKEIMKDYNVKDISHNKLKQMGEELVELGAWTVLDYGKNIPFNVSLPGHEPKGLEGTGLRFEPDTSMDFIALFEKELEQALAYGGASKNELEVRQNRIDIANDLYDLHNKAIIEQQLT